MFEICRVCLIESDDLISLKSDDAESLMILHMLSEFTLKNTEEQLSKYICNNCTNILDMAYEFKRKYEDSIIKYIRQKNEVINLTGDPDCFEVTSKPYEDCVKDEDQLKNDLQSDFKIMSCYSLHDVYQSSVMKSISDHDTELQNTESGMCLNFDPHKNVSEEMVKREQSNFTQNKNEIQAIAVQSIQHKDKPEDVLEKRLNCEQDQDRPKEILQKCLDVNQEQSRAELVKSSNCHQHSNWAVDEVQSSVGLVDFHKPESQPPVEFVITLKGHQVEDQSQSKLSKRSNSEQHIHEPEAELVRHSNRKPVLKIGLSDIRPTESHEDKEIFRRNPRFTKVVSRKRDRTMTNKILNKIYICHGNRRKPFLCDVCHRWFKNKGHIKTHRMLHIQAQREIKCGDCVLRFLTKTHFEKHKCFY